ncbi:PIN domain-containing protein [Tunturiibacter gelidoferens]|uniref:DUF4935 domain-containing protein n=1 Tax=Tunturiibacter lichenicola TaxID=2051959 RepID=A0A7Y9T2E5_9BACT|nr:PIN domain-containing protein [Edaphobacter lichenicola]NYF51086.1 hypothetical protein [Edaphobacter lichenicola]
MNVVLDTNAIVSLGLTNPAFGSLRDYLRKTKSRLLLPEVVLEELRAQRRSAVSKSVRKGLEADKELAASVPGYRPVVKHLNRIDPETAADALEADLKTLTDKVSTVENQPADLKELVRRLANRIPPASPAGEEARDVLIWLAVLRLARKDELAFVTGDKKAFHKDGNLKPELEKELNSVSNAVAVYEGLDAFLKVHHARSSWIDKEWVEAQVESSLVDSAIERYINGKENRLVMPSVDHEGAKFTGYSNFVQVVQRDVENFFVSDMVSGAMMVGVSLWAELEIEIEFEIGQDVWLSRSKGPTSQVKVVYPVISADLQLEVANKSLKSVTVSDIERA